VKRTAEQAIVAYFKGLRSYSHRSQLSIAHRLTEVYMLLPVLKLLALRQRHGGTDLKHDLGNG
jgi:hypothetical protein